MSYQDDGPRSARIVVIGEALGETEERVERPFQGPSGWRLNEWMSLAGVDRRDVFVTNVVCRRPEKNKIETVPHDELQNWIDQLHDRLVKLADPYVLVPTGNVALRALTGREKDTITQARGFIQTYVDRNGRTMKVIPIIHPAATFRTPHWQRRCQLDWRRIATEAASKRLDLTQSEHLTKPTIGDCYAYVEEVQKRRDIPLSVDIETPGHRIGCVGFAQSGKFSFTVPTTLRYWGGQAELDEVWQIIKALCASDAPKVLQNGCVPGDVEVLTHTGWVRFDRLLPGTAIAEWDMADESVNFGVPIRLFEYDNAALLRAKARGHDCAYTRDHRIVFASPKKPWQVAKVDETAKRARIEIPVAGILSDGLNTTSVPMIRLLVAAQADAYLSPSGAVFNLKKRRKIDRLKELCTEYGTAPVRLKRGNGEESYSIRGEAGRTLWRYVADNEWGEWVLRLPLEQRRELLDELRYWDASSHGRGYRYFSISDGNHKLLGGVAAITGWTARQLSKMTSFFSPSSRTTVQRHNWTVRPTRGRVYCAQTNTGFFLARSRGKVFVTGNSYDAYWLAEKDVFLHNYKYDCMAMHHALDAADDHNLAYMASINLRMRPWKHIPKDSDVSWRAAPSDELQEALTGSKSDALMVYNGIDNIVQWQLADIFEPRLHAAGLWQLYDTHYVQMFKPLLTMMRHGIAVDEEARKKRYDVFRTKIDALQEGLLAATNGIDLRGAPNKKRIAAGKLRDLSSKKVVSWLYDTMKIPKQISRKTGAVTGDEIAIRKAMLKHPRVAPVCELILEHRRTKMVLGSLDVGALDPDGRLRSSYGFAPETGRLSSSKNPKGTGKNGQNVDREIRGIFVPDDDCIFVELDESQAEDRIVKVLAYCVVPRQELLDRARAMPWENDEHKRAAMVIFHIPDTAVSKDQRYIGKRGRHAGNYGLGGQGLADQLIKDGYVYTPQECADFIAAVIDRDTPEIREWQKATRIEILKRKRLTNDWGRVLDFTWDRMDDDTFRRAYAFLPQSSVPSILNQYGMIPLYHAIKTNGWRASINVNGHDSLLISVSREDAWKVYDFTRRSLERPRYYGDKRIELTIPTELKIGLNWAFEGGVEFKRPPRQDEFEAATLRLT